MLLAKETIDIYDKLNLVADILDGVAEEMPVVQDAQDLVYEILVLLKENLDESYVGAQDVCYLIEDEDED